MRKVLFALCLLAAACGKKKEESSSAKATTEAKDDDKAKAPEEKPKQPLTAAWIGKTVAPPGELAKLKPGMKMDEAKKASPLAGQAGTQESEIQDVSYAVQAQPNDTIDVMIYLPGDKKAVIEEAWGKGQDVDRGGKPVTVWFNADTGVRAAWSVGSDNGGELRFEAYTPLAKLLGEGPQIAALAKPFAGKTQDELKTVYPELVADDRVELPATEWEFGGSTPLSPYPMDGKIESLAFSIPFKTAEQQAEIMKVIETKWGKAKGKVDFTEGAFVYNKKDPHIEVTQPDGGYNKDKITIRIGGK
ncbi:MAG: hypothetical protein HOV81_16165 [Kofleriaceae bacterium]|nr:hypothetical protein [Kofleriaceae bacterium]